MSGLPTGGESPSTLDVVVAPAGEIVVFESTGIAVYRPDGDPLTTRFALPPELTMTAASLGADGAIWMGGNFGTPTQLGSFSLQNLWSSRSSIWLAVLGGIFAP